MCQGDHGRYGANYRCCLPALAGFVSPHSMGPDAQNSVANFIGCRDKARGGGGDADEFMVFECLHKTRLEFFLLQSKLFRRQLLQL